MHSWLPWVLLACLLILPVLLRLLVGEDEPDNAITHEQDGTEKKRDPGPPLLTATA